MATKPSKTSRIKSLLTDIPKEKRNEAKQLAEEALLIEDKLNKTKLFFESEDIVEEYNNGGGQTGTRENPTHSAYQKLLKTYIQSLGALDAMRQPADSRDYLPSWLR